MNLKKSFLVLSILSLNLFNAQSYKKPLVSAITEKDLRTDMYQMAADQFWGREAGTLDELKVSMWFADKIKEQKFLLFFSFYSCYLCSLFKICISNSIQNLRQLVINLQL